MDSFKTILVNVITNTENSRNATAMTSKVVAEINKVFPDRAVFAFIGWFMIIDGVLSIFMNRPAKTFGWVKRCIRIILGIGLLMRIGYT
jgi:hypothetical protein